MNAPQYLFVTLNARCNYRCGHCKWWLRDQEGRGAKPHGEKLDAIREFSDLSPHGAVVICGGEAMLDPLAFWDTCRAARAAGLRVIYVTNASRISDAAIAERIIEQGPTELTVSLDSHLATEHNEVRGCRFAFQRAVSAIELLVDLRAAAEHGSHRPRIFRLFTMGVVSERNYRDLPKMIRFSRNLGVDRHKANFLQPSFGGEYPDSYFARNHVRDPADCMRVLCEVSREFDLGWRPEWFLAVRDYLESVVRNGNAFEGWRHFEGTRDVICNSSERNIMLDEDNRLSLCFDHRFGSERYVPGKLRDFWERAPREKMKRCRRYCGISHSVRREPATGKGIQ